MIESAQNAGILEQCMEAKYNNQVGIGFSFRPAAYIGWRIPELIKSLKIPSLYGTAKNLCLGQQFLYPLEVSRPDIALGAFIATVSVNRKCYDL
jgi:hypothetical protein